MNELSLSRPMRKNTRYAGRPRRSTRLAPHCEPLESRQLLSVAQTSLGALTVSNPVAAQTTITVPTVLFGFSPTGFTAVDVEIGTLSGLSQFQINFSNSGFSSAFTFNESVVFSSAFGASEVFSIFSSTTPNDASSAPASGIGGIGTSGTGTVSGGNGSSSPSSAQSGATPITPLNPSAPSGRAPVVVVVTPIQLIVVHLGASAAPVTMLPVSSLVAVADNVPASLTHFGQDADSAWRRQFLDSRGFVDEPTPFIDFVEPYHPVAPDAAPVAAPRGRGDDAPVPRAARIPAVPALSESSIDALLDLTTPRALYAQLPGNSPAGTTTRQDGSEYTWNLSTVFGAAVVAAGGYHLVMRDSERFRGSAVPRWAGADRPFKRKSSFPAR
jgi:hypothetical protein